MGGDEDVGPCLGFGTMCLGLCVLLPCATYLTAWNEKSAVCRQWAVQSAQDSAQALKCDSYSQTKDGSALKVGELGFLACPLDETTFSKFAGSDFHPKLKLPTLFGKVTDKTAGRAVSAKMVVKMWQCEEFCSRTEQHCNRRLQGTPVLRIQEEGNLTQTSERRLLSRRFKEVGQERHLKDKDKKKSKSCRDVCVAWDYNRVLKSSSVRAHQHDNGGLAAAACGIANAPASPIGFGKTVFSPSGQVKTSPNKIWELNAEQVTRLPIDKLLTPPDRSNSRLSNSPPPTQWSLDFTNTMVASGKLYTCAQNSNNMGCLQVTFMKAIPTKVAMLSKVGIPEDCSRRACEKRGSIPGVMDPKGWQAPGYWVCGETASENNIDAFCPSSASLDLAKGAISCNDSIDTIEKIVDMLQKAGDQKLMVFRILGFILFWSAISACLQPIRSILGLLANGMDAATDCIPCVGSGVDFLTDIFMGVVKAILCLVSFCFGGGCFLSVVVIMWFVMKPLMGLLLSFVLCACCGTGGYLLHMNRSGKSARDLKLTGGDEPMTTEVSEMSGGS